MKLVELTINEAREFGYCYVGSWQDELAVRTGKMVEKIERYARKHQIETEYVNKNDECYLIVK